MADLRIVDAPEIPTENITGEEKLPTGGNGNYSISLDSVADYTKTKKDLADNTSVDNKVNGVRQELNIHIEDSTNPHQVTKNQIGLGNVDNTADADKPVSNSTQAAIISAVTTKADKTYVDTVLSDLSTEANKFYPTLAEANADIANIAVNQPVSIGEVVNGGLWYKATVGATTLTKSTYDPLALAKEYSDSKVVLDTADELFALRDQAGKLTILMRKDGELYLPNIAKSVQNFLNYLDLKIKEIDGRVEYDMAKSLIKILDVNGSIVASIAGSGSLHIRDVVTQNGSVEKRLKYLEENSSQGMAVELLKSTDRAIAARDNDSRLDNVNITSAATLSVNQVMAPSLVRITKNKFFLVITAGGSGDFALADVIGYFITVNADYTLTISGPITVASRGTDVNGEYAATGGAALYVNKGIHAGRIYVYFIKRYSTESDVMCHVYSDDMGVTWSAVVDMTPFIPLAESWRITLASPAKMIQIQKGAYEGRIILPCWHGDVNYPASQAGLKAFIMYSDDGGETYTIGAESANAGSNESAVAEFDGDKLMFLTRNASLNKATEVSYDGGVTLQDLRILDEVETTKVQSGFVQASNRFDLSTPKLIISTPSVSGVRENLGLYISYDNKNFNMFSQIQTGVAAYSDLEIIDESNILVIYVGGVYTSIDAVIANLKQLMLGA